MTTSNARHLTSNDRGDVAASEAKPVRPTAVSKLLPGFTVHSQTEFEGFGLATGFKVQAVSCGTLLSVHKVEVFSDDSAHGFHINHIHDAFYESDLDAMLAMLRAAKVDETCGKCGGSGVVEGPPPAWGYNEYFTISCSCQHHESCECRECSIPTLPLSSRI